MKSSSRTPTLQEEQRRHGYHVIKQGRHIRSQAGEKSILTSWLGFPSHGAFPNLVSINFDPPPPPPTSWREETCGEGLTEVTASHDCSAHILNKWELKGPFDHEIRLC